MSRSGRKVLFAFSIPWTLTVSYPFVFLACALGFARMIQWHPGGVLTAVWRPWVAKKWRYSTTLGYGMIFHPSADRGDLDEVDTRIEKHERIHTFQIQDQMVLSFILAAVSLLFGAQWWAALLLWWSGGLWQLVNFVTSMLRHGPARQFGLEQKSWISRLFDNAYRQSEHERSAYAQTDLVTQIAGHEASWQDLQRAWIEYQRGNLKAWLADNT